MVSAAVGVLGVNGSIGNSMTAEAYSLQAHHDDQFNFDVSDQTMGYPGEGPDSMTKDPWDFMQVNPRGRQALPDQLGMGCTRRTGRSE